MTGQRVLALAATVGWLGCAASSSVTRSDLPDDPVAILYRTADEGRQRAEQLRAARAGRETPEGIAQWSDLERLLGSREAHTAGRLALLDPRSGEPRPLEHLPAGALPLDWSPDRARLLFVQPVRDRHQLFEIDLGSQELRQVTRAPRAHPMGCYLPDGRLVVAALYRTRERHELRLLLTEAGGGRPQPLSPGPWDAFPACSPRGDVVAFSRADERGREQLTVMDLASREVRTLAPGTHPAFTPDGAWIVYSARTSKGHRLWRMRPDGTGKAPLGARFGSEVVEATPSVSPDGRFVAYVLKEDDRDRLRLRRLDGRGDRPLLEFGDGTAPAW